MLVLYGGAAPPGLGGGSARGRPGRKASPPPSAALTFLAITFLNPVYLDTVGLVGVVGSRYEGALQFAFWQER